MENTLGEHGKELIERSDAPTPATNGGGFFDIVERLASRPDIPVEKIKQIMEMQERVLDRNAHQAFNAAMTTVQNKIELVVSKEKNEQTHSRYANLKDILVQTKPVYTAEGFSLMFYEGESSRPETHKRICVDIIHREGHTEKRHGEFAIQTKGIAGKPMMTQIHGEGSAISYGRRYLTCMIFNIPTGDDDDGNAAGGGPPITEKQAGQILDMILAKEIDQDEFLKYIGAESIETIPAKKFAYSMNTLKKAKGGKK